MANFKKVKFKDICERIDYGFTASASEFKVGPKFLRITDIAQSSIDWDNVPYCTISESEKNKYLLSDGDIVVARTGATTGYAKCLKNPQEAIFASYLVRFRVNKINDNRFIGHIIESLAYKTFIKNNCGGSAQPQANAQILGSYELSLPEPKTQSRIASVLSAYDDLIENNEKRIKVLEEMAQRLYTEWFVKFKFPGHEKVRMIPGVPRCNASIQNIPEGWSVKSLGDKIQVKKGKNITKETVIDGDIPVVAGGLDPAYFHNKPNAKKPVVTVSASGANAGFVKLYFQDVWASDCSYIDVSVTKHVYFYYLFLKNKQEEISRLQRGSAQPHVYPKDLMELIIADASNELIDKFIVKVTPILDLVGDLKIKIRNLSKIRDLLIPQLVTGKRELK